LPVYKEPVFKSLIQDGENASLQADIVQDCCQLQYLTDHGDIPALDEYILIVREVSLRYGKARTGHLLDA
jgi:hypothetical protein